MLTPYHFFLKHAGYSYGNGETKQQERIRCARALAKNERAASKGGFTYVWSVDPHTDSSDFSDESPAWSLWQCCMLNADGRIVNSLHAIDFGRDGEPWGDPYQRVVEAELASEGLTNKPQGFYGRKS